MSQPPFTQPLDDRRLGELRALARQTNTDISHEARATLHAHRIAVHPQDQESEYPNTETGVADASPAPASGATPTVPSGGDDTLTPQQGVAPSPAAPAHFDLDGLLS